MTRLVLRTTSTVRSGTEKVLITTVDKIIHAEYGYMLWNYVGEFAVDTTVSVANSIVKGTLVRRMC